MFRLTVSALGGSTVTAFPPAAFPPLFPGFFPFGPNDDIDKDNVRLSPTLIFVKRSKLVDIGSDFLKIFFEDFVRLSSTNRGAQIFKSYWSRRFTKKS